MEAIYDDIASGDDVAPKIGFMAFAPVVPARGSMFGAVNRTSREMGRSENLEPVVSETDLYGK
ncbi:MAG: hypothetical protein ACLP07_01590 [Terracidiphilus sp.]